MSVPNKTAASVSQVIFLAQITIHFFFFSFTIDTVVNIILAGYIAKLSQTFSRCLFLEFYASILPLSQCVPLKVLQECTVLSVKQVNTYPGLIKETGTSMKNSTSGHG